MMDMIYVTITSLCSVVILFLLTKLLGYRQISHMSMFDYISSITIGSIAAEFATSLEDDWKKPLIAIVVYTLFNFLIDLLTNKSIKMRRIINGKAVILYGEGELYYKNLKKAKMDVGEFFMQCRNMGCFDLQQARTILLEPNGKLSILFMSDQEQKNLLANVIMEGKIMRENLKNIGKDETWLKKALMAYNNPLIEDIFLATCSQEGKLIIYKKVEQEENKDLLM